MPHPKNRLKLTGDTHLPDVGFEPIAEERVEMLMLVPEEEAQPRVYADGWVPAAQETGLQHELAPEAEAKDPQPQGMAQAAVRKMGWLPAKSPWLAMGVALGLGWLAARMLRAMQR